MYNLDLLEENMNHIIDIYKLIGLVSRKIENFMLKKEVYKLSLYDVYSWRVSVIEEIMHSLLEVETIALDKNYKDEYFNGCGLNLKKEFFDIKRREVRNKNNSTCGWCGECLECIKVFDDYLNKSDMFVAKVSFSNRFNLNKVEDWCHECINIAIWDLFIEDCQMILDSTVSDDGRVYELIVMKNALLGYNTEYQKTFYIDFYADLVVSLKKLVRSMDK